MLHQDLPEPAGLCGRMQGAIVRCGFMAYELALLGTPMVLLHATPIQAEVALALQAEGRAVALAEEALAQPGALAQALAAMRKLCPLPMNQVRRPGAERVARLMENFDD